MTKTVSSNCEEQQPSASRDADYLTSTDSSNYKITEGDLNDLISDLKILKIKAEHLVSVLKQCNLLHHSAKVTKFRTRDREFEQFLKTVASFIYCKDIVGPMDATHMGHIPEHWRLFIDASKNKS
jgi:hypothetical protein